MRSHVVFEGVPTGIVVGAAAVFGAVFGSFLNVCILRWGAEPKQSVVRPPSRCPRCGHSLRWYENVPVFSWLVLRGRCRGCGLPISVQYPLIELTVAVIWGGMVWWFGPGLAAVAGAVFFTILLGIAVTDARAYIIPDEFSLGGLVIGLVLAALAGWNSFLVAALGAAVGFGLLWLVAVGGTWLFKREAMGGGDIKMMAMVGSFVGPKDGAGWWHGVLGVLLTVFAGALFGTIIFVPLSLRKKRLVPFGVFLAVGAAVTYIWGDLIFDWYRRFVSGG
jgi:leader peptidase (prepilin peptidase) / N-methyltransferase